MKSRHWVAGKRIVTQIGPETTFQLSAIIIAGDNEHETWDSGNDLYHPGSQKAVNLSKA